MGVGMETSVGAGVDADELFRLEMELCA